ncbi:hypothetical protein KM043_012629 [Ampulex compressa]|nr:hypothetical protein KM043_012629 [Ampulex compressa]
MTQQTNYTCGQCVSSVLIYGKAEHALETLQENAYIRLGQRCGYDIKWICANPKVREKCNVERFCEFFWSYYVYMKTYNHDNVPNLPEASTLFV